MDKNHPRFSTSEELLNSALKTAAKNLNVETKLIKLSDLNFRHCEGFYSKSEKACTWPCSITKMDPTDEMSQIDEGMIITGGQDNIQSVAGQMLNFFGELGFMAPPFPYVGHSLGWSSEAMEYNMDYVRDSEYLHTQSYELIERAVELSKKLIQA